MKTIIITVCVLTLLAKRIDSFAQGHVRVGTLYPSRQSIEQTICYSTESKRQSPIITGDSDLNEDSCFFIREALVSGKYQFNISTSIYHSS